MTYSSNFMTAVGRTLGLEGGFVNDGYDHGGATNFGITAEVAARHGVSDVSTITRDKAIEIYYLDYWLPLRLDEINSAPLTSELFDTAVNCGISIAAQNLQEAFNVLFTPAFDVLKVDGKIGPITLNMVNNQLPRYEIALWKACNGEQYIHYKQIKRSNPGYAARYIRGWSANRL